MRELNGILWQKLYKSMQRYPHSEEYESEFYQFIHTLPFKASIPTNFSQT